VTRNKKSHLDAVDLRILVEFARDASRSNREVSKCLDMPEATVRHRMHTLLGREVVAFDLVINPDMSRWKAICYMQVMLRSNSETKIREFIRKFGRLANVTSIETISNEYDLILRVEAEDGDALTQTRRDISDSPLVSRVVTLHVQKNRKRYRLPFGALLKLDALKPRRTRTRREDKRSKPGLKPGRPRPH
jgi:DNA-binding Lrp family transcriptional regulator